MLTLAKLSGPSSATSSYLTRDDASESKLYYDGNEKGDSAVGILFGEGAERLGVAGFFSAKDQRFRTLFDGLHPSTGKPLRQGAGRTRIYYQKNGNEKRYRSPGGYDLTFSVPKPVSVMWALTPRLRPNIEKCAHEAMRKALQEVLIDKCITRVGASGKNKEKAHPIFAAFTHHSNRANDPQLHIHCVLLNTVIRENGRGGALDARFLFRIHNELGQSFRDHLARELSRHLHLEIDWHPIKNGTSFKIRGIPDELCQVFSKRHAQVEAMSSPDASSKEKHRVVLRTRAKKDPTISLEELTDRWQREAEPYGFKAYTLSKKIPAQNTKEVTRAIDNTNKATAQIFKDAIRGDSDLQWAFENAEMFLDRFNKQPLTNNRQHIWSSQTVQSIGRHLEANRSPMWKVYEGLFLEPAFLKTRWGPELAHAIGMISKKNRNFLLSKYGWKPAGYGLPRRKWAIELSYATFRISKTQREYLLSLYAHEKGGVLNMSAKDHILKAFKKQWSSERMRLDTLANREQNRRYNVAQGYVPKPENPPIRQRPEYELGGR